MDKEEKWIFRDEIGPHDLGVITGRIIREWEDKIITEILNEEKDSTGKSTKSVEEG